MIRNRNGYLKTPNYAYANNAEPIADDDEFTTSVNAMGISHRLIEEPADVDHIAADIEKAYHRSTGW